MIYSRRSFLYTASRSIAGGALMLLLPQRLIRAAVRKGTYLERAVYAMGTTVSLSLFGDDRPHLLHASNAAFAELHRLETLLSVYRPDSDISKLNRSAGRDPVIVSHDTWTVLERAKRAHAISGGTFDVTIEPLMERWGFRSDDITTLRTESSFTIGDQHLHLTPGNSVLLDRPQMKVDTGGIAVGYAVDRMAEVLRAQGIRSALINHGGDVYALGAPDDTPGWEVVVPHPLEPDVELMNVYLTDRALSTSSNTATTRARSGRTIGHIFDPRTKSNPEVCVSMSVLAPSSCDADAMSTALFVSGDTASGRKYGYDHIALFPGERVDTSLR